MEGRVSDSMPCWAAGHGDGSDGSGVLQTVGCCNSERRAVVEVEQTGDGRVVTQPHSLLLLRSLSRRDILIRSEDVQRCSRRTVICAGSAAANGLVGDGRVVGDGACVLDRGPSNMTGVMAMRSAAAAASEAVCRAAATATATASFSSRGR